MKKQIITLLIVLLVSSFFLGIFTGVYKTFPYYYLDNAKKIILSEPEIEIDTMSEHVYDVNVSSLIKIKSTDDIVKKRNSLIQYLWNSNSLPSIYPTVTKNINDLHYEELNNLKEIDKLTIEMDHGINSIAYHFIPKNDIKKLVIYHQGHSGDFFNGKNTIQYFLENGYSVLALSMPLMGMNNQPLIEVPEFGTIILKSHDHLKFLESSNVKPIKFFMEPITASLNYIDDSYDYETITMIGISGGGWASVVYPAIDTRINHSYSVAGSYPLFMQSSFTGLSDYEAIVPEFYKNANYLELYIMASHGENRKLIQIFNEFDSCCWSGDSFKIYEFEVKKIIENLGNAEFDIWLDSTHKEHKISQFALDKILKSMNSDV